jgi:hypothetical protein
VLFFAGQLQGLGIAWDYFLAGKVNFHSTLEGITTVSPGKYSKPGSSKDASPFALSMLVTTKSLNFKGTSSEAL